MNIWALADLHLSISCPHKTMEDFGPVWSHYMEKIQNHWLQQIQPTDLVLLPGDITWARTLEEAKEDLKWIDKLPGQKIMIRGNHDSWWQSLNKIQAILPKSILALQNDAWNTEDYAIGGARLWETTEYSNAPIIELKKNPKANPKTPHLNDRDNDRIYQKELYRLELSLKKMDPHCPLKIVMTHYPPLSFDLQSSKAHEMLKDFKIDICVFGHLHNIYPHHPPLFGQKEGISYLLAAADYLEFKPLKIK